MWVVVARVAIWLFGDKIVKYTLYAVAGALVFTFVEAAAATTAIMSQPFGQWWLAGVGGGAPASTASAPIEASPAAPAGAVVVPPLHAGAVSDVERYQLARAVGFPSTDLVLAVAISLAEDPAGDPSAMSPKNWNGTYDLGLWQINSIHWAKCGGQAALVVPLMNAVCAVGILGPGRNWCAWSTYEESCGVGHTGGYRGSMRRARDAAAAAQGGE